ncbi:hypothetical protein T10_4860 [Trichinella papuae]|uniref:Uncharacterized protein n=1 Tax=Trichinella papuae TaxID=268474 RepID=A0A0V1MFV4_9BILA|nr:hypothetical protein T10_4860 [Trichinella papuae]
MVFWGEMDQLAAAINSPQRSTRHDYCVFGIGALIHIINITSFFGSSTASTSSLMGFSSISFVLETFFDSTSNRNKTATKAKAIKENRDILAYQ